MPRIVPHNDGPKMEGKGDHMFEANIPGSTKKGTALPKESRLRKASFSLALNPRVSTSASGSLQEVMKARQPPPVRENPPDDMEGSRPVSKQTSNCPSNDEQLPPPKRVV